MSWWYGSCNGDGKIRKPLIFIEGLDPLECNFFDWDRQLFNLTKKGLIAGTYDDEDGIPLMDKLHEEEYDFFFINYKNGTDDIKKNAMWVQQAIEWINEQKALNDSVEKNVVMGGSMGGLVAE